MEAGVQSDDLKAGTARQALTTGAWKVYLPLSILVLLSLPSAGATLPPIGPRAPARQAPPRAVGAGTVATRTAIATRAAGTTLFVRTRRFDGRQVVATQRVALVDPHLHANNAVRGVRFRRA